jgi:hypothetical protein
MGIRLWSAGPDKLKNITDMYTDSFFSYGVYSFLNSHIRHARQDTSTAFSHHFRFLRESNLRPRRYCNIVSSKLFISTMYFQIQ